MSHKDIFDRRDDILFSILEENSIILMESSKKETLADILLGGISGAAGAVGGVALSGGQKALTYATAGAGGAAAGAAIMGLSMAFVKKYGLKPLNNQMPTKQNTLKLINNAKNKKELRRVKIYLAFLRGNVYIFSKKKGLEKREDNKAYDDLYKNVLKPAIQKKEQQLKSLKESYDFEDDYDEIYEFENFIIEENIRNL